MLVFVTVPFKGHYNVILNAAQHYGKQNQRVHIVILTWSNFTDIPSDNKLISQTVLVSELPISSSRPTEFTWDRAETLIPKLYSLFLKFHKYNVIDSCVYDFFCPEAAIVCDLMRIPSICSIPAIFSAGLTENKTLNDNDNYHYHDHAKKQLLPIFERLKKTFNLDNEFLNVDKIHPVSDSFYLEGSQKQWLWGHPSLYQNLRLPQYFSNPIFLKRSIPINDDANANDNANDNANKNINNIKDIIYVCLGTVVTGNLWDKNLNSRKLATFVYETVITWSITNSYNVIICTPGINNMRNNLSLDETSLKNVMFTEKVDQIALLNNKELKLFVTHGGGNSISEAIDANVPMVVIPFFGDQHVSADLISYNNFGLSFKHSNPASAIDTMCGSAALELSLSDDRISPERKDELNLLLNKAVSLKYTAINNAKSIGYDDIQNLVYFKNGDLLFGTNNARIRFAELYNNNKANKHINFAINDFNPHSNRINNGTVENDSLPSLIDQYNDVLRLDDTDPVKIDEMKFNIGSEYNKHLCSLDNHLRKNVFANTHYKYPPGNDLDSLWHACCGGLDYFLNNTERKDTCIHFVLNLDYDSNINKATMLEIKWIKEHYDQVYSRVKFYWIIDNNNVLEQCNPLMLDWFEWTEPQLTTFLKSKSKSKSTSANDSFKFVLDLIPELKKSVKTIYCEHRLKTVESLHEKINKRMKREGINDVIGIRLIHVWTSQLFIIANSLIQLLQSNNCIVIDNISERGSVIHLFIYSLTFNTFIEIQLWPAILHICFESEHNTMYKPKNKNNTTDKDIENSKRLRENEHNLQNLIDQSESLFPFLS